MTETSIDWVPLETRKWIAGTTELDADAEFVFFRLCLLAYETGDAVLDRSARRLALWCKVELARYEGALELLIETGKVRHVEAGLFVPSAARRIDEANSKISARQVGAAKARRIGQLKREGKSQDEISLIISDEFPDVQAEKPTEKKTTQKTRLEENTPEGFLGEGAAAPRVSQADIAFGLWNEFAGANNLPVATSFTDQRKSRLKARLKDAGGLEGWKRALELVAASPFLMGRRSDFRADFDFLMQKSKFTKLLEGGYAALTAERVQQISGAMQALKGQMTNGD